MDDSPRPRGDHVPLKARAVRHHVSPPPARGWSQAIGTGRWSRDAGLREVDLARRALIAAQKAAKKNSASRVMMTERGLTAPAAGGSELAGRTWAVTFDADSGRLDVAPDAPAYGTQLRWITPKLITAANERVPSANVRALHILPPAPAKAGAATATTPDHHPVVPVAPVQRHAPSDGYRRALEAHRAAARGHQVDPSGVEAAGRRTGDAREHGQRAFPEPDAAWAAPALIETDRTEQCRGTGRAIPDGMVAVCADPGPDGDNPTG